VAHARLGVTTAAMCFSKLQSAPIALTLALAALLLAWMLGAVGSRGRPASSSEPPLFVAFCALFLYHGVFDEFWQSMWLETSLQRTHRRPLPSKILATAQMFLAQGEFRWYNVASSSAGWSYSSNGNAIARRRPQIRVSARAQRRSGSSGAARDRRKTSGPVVFVLVLRPRACMRSRSRATVRALSPVPDGAMDPLCRRRDIVGAEQ